MIEKLKTIDGIEAKELLRDIMDEDKNVEWQKEGDLERRLKKMYKEELERERHFMINKLGVTREREEAELDISLELIYPKVSVEVT